MMRTTITTAAYATCATVGLIGFGLWLVSPFVGIALLTLAILAGLVSALILGVE